MVDDLEERQGRVVGHFQIDVRQHFELPPQRGTLHVSARLLHLWTPPVAVVTD